jgi:hypothetical protein
LCTKSQQVLIDNKVLYPEYFIFPKQQDYYQHSAVARMSQKRDLKNISVFLKYIYKQSTEKSCNVTLISGEDFENFLVDTHLAKEFEDLARSTGFSNIEWIVVQRNPSDYLLSIYAEKSGYKMVLDLGLIANSILEYGFFSASSSSYNYKFVFDIKKFSKFFKDNVNSNLIVINFDNFLDDFVGKVIFRNLVNNKSLTNLRENAMNIGKKRKRPVNEKIEFRYLANFLGMKADKEFHTNNKKLVDLLISHRMKRNEDLLKEIQIKFKEQFE